MKMLMMMKSNIVTSLFIAILFFFVACNNSEVNKDTPTTGEITIAVDETYKPLIDSQVDTFESIYKYAEVTTKYLPVDSVFHLLMNDSIKLIIVPRSLNNEELEQFKRWEIVPKINKIAYDAVAIIGSKNLKDSTLTLKEIAEYIDAKNNNRSKKAIKIVFDNNNSSTISFIKEKTGVFQFSSNCYALDSNIAVLDYVAKHKNTIGIIGVNWISDKDDSTHLNFLKTIKVFAISKDENSEALKPYQAYIAQKTYPLYREIYTLSKEAYSGLGTGFTAFMASDRGQRIVLKFGLVPATMPIRLVEIIHEEL